LGDGPLVVVVVGVAAVVVVVGAGFAVVVVVCAGGFVEVPDDGELVVIGGVGRCVVDVVGVLDVVGVEEVVVTFDLLRFLLEIPFERPTSVLVDFFFDEFALDEVTPAWDDTDSD
jgi:hypothetical protein